MTIDLIVNSAIQEFSNESVAAKFRTYPVPIRNKLMHLRSLIFEVALESPDVTELEETLKWGEPSYLAKGGSTVRVGWQERDPKKYGMYFNCNSKLVSTFKELYSESLRFEGNRAIVFDCDDVVDEAVLKHCIAMALQYHKLKMLPLLGA